MQCTYIEQYVIIGQRVMGQAKLPFKLNRLNAIVQNKYDR